MIRAVLFDFGGVLTESPQRLFQRLAETSGATIAEIAALLLGPYAGPGDHPWHRLERGEIPFSEICRWGAEEGTLRGWRVDLAPLPSLLAELAIRPAMIERVRTLRREGYSTAIITNNVREFGAAWKAGLPLDELFDQVIDSCEVGFRKPEARIYELALERLGDLAPAEAVFLDDFADNVRGAEQVGIPGILVGDDWQSALARLDAHLRASG